MITVVHEVTFATKEEKAAYMQAAAQEDSRTPAVISAAQRFRGFTEPGSARGPSCDSASTAFSTFAIRASKCSTPQRLGSGAGTGIVT